MEQVCGLVAYHLQKLKQLECVSRSMIFYEEVAQVKDIKLTLTQKMKEIEKFAEAFLGEQNGCENSITIEQFCASLKKIIVC